MNENYNSASHSSTITIKPYESISLEASWKKYLAEEFNKDYMLKLKSFLITEIKYHSPIYPAPKNFFQALNLTPFNKVKAVILGQDPYHEPNQAHGLSFSVPEGVKIPPSLVNIYKELQSDVGCPIHSNGYLKKWADEGVLLLNSVLSVRHSQAGSHSKKGWETFTDRVIQCISENKTHVVFLLWGRYAISKTSLIDQSKHLVLTAPHPSPLSAYSGFFGCRHFSKTNNYLISHGIAPIDWSLDNYHQ